MGRGTGTIFTNFLQLSTKFLDFIVFETLFILADLRVLTIGEFSFSGVMG